MNDNAKKTFKMLSEKSEEITILWQENQDLQQRIQLGILGEEQKNKPTSWQNIKQNLSKLQVYISKLIKKAMVYKHEQSWSMILDNY